VPPSGHEEFIGKVESLAYDRFGDFEGFTLETLAGTIHRFDSREPGIAELCLWAWVHRVRIRVVTDKAHPHRPDAIIFVL
jgi:hypothetical protein